jgi:hypothetical protein
VIDTLNKESNAGLAVAKIRARLADVGGVPMPMTPAAAPSTLCPIRVGGRRQRQFRLGSNSAVRQPNNAKT